MIQRLGMFGRTQLLRKLDNVHPAPRADYPVDAGNFLDELRPQICERQPAAINVCWRRLPSASSRSERIDSSRAGPMKRRC